MEVDAVLTLPSLLAPLEALLDLTFPVDCLSCGEPPERGSLCSACRALVAPRAGPRCVRCDAGVAGVYAFCGRCLAEPPAFERAWGVYDYLGPVGDALRAGKYDGRPDALPLVARLVRGALPSELREDPPQVVLPVPLHPRRLARRGVDAPLLLAHAAAGRLGVPCRRKALRRTRDTPPQAGLSERQRRENLRGAFAPAGGAFPADVLIVDDVMTTGATARAVAAAARDAGARRVRVLTAALADRSGGG